MNDEDKEIEKIFADSIERLNDRIDELKKELKLTEEIKALLENYRDLRNDCIHPNNDCRY